MHRSIADLIARLSGEFQFVAVLFGLFLSVSLAHATTRNAASPNYSDVAAAVSQAGTGDTVVIPAGTATWASNLAVTKAITIQGAGTTSGSNLTQISGAGFTFHPNIDSLTRLTGIHFYQSNWIPSYINVFQGPCTKFRIDHCKFTRGSHVISFNFPAGTGFAYGVVDHNTFVNPNTGVFVTEAIASEKSWGSTIWAAAPPPGGADTVCIEDNTFLSDNEWSDLTNNNNQVMYGQYGAKATFRHNTQTDTGTNATSIDAHGGPDRGTYMYEVYENTFNCNNGYGYFFLRGGHHIWFNNKVTYGGPQSTLIQLADEEGFPAGSHDPVSNSYFWNNTLNNVQWTGPIQPRGGWNPPYSGQMNVNYWMHAPQSGQSYSSYSPLTYPHPLVGGAGATPTPQPSASPQMSPAPGPGASPAPTGGISFAASSGTISNPFVVNNDGSVSQAIETDDPTQSGSAVYNFNVSSAGNYGVVAQVNCPDDGSNSFFINMDGQPNTNMTWFIAPTSGLETRVVTWGSDPSPHTWNLTAGDHQLILRGREAGAQIDQITVVPAPSPGPSNLRLP